MRVQTVVRAAFWTLAAFAILVLPTSIAVALAGAQF